MPAASFGRWRTALAPGAGLEARQRLFSGVGIDGAIDVLQRRRQSLAILPGHEVHGIAQQMDDAGLNGRIREHGGDDVRKALEAVEQPQAGYLRRRGSSARS